jgi:phosphatidylinositol-3-phosphatase
MEVRMQRFLKLAISVITALTLTFTATLLAEPGPIPGGIGHLDHVFVIVMENHAYSQIIGNPQAPFANAYARAANTADDYFAIAHPSLTNYLELVGGSNFGVLSDNSPDWHNLACKPNIAAPYSQNRDDNGGGDVCPIAGSGTDAATVAVDTTNEITKIYVPSLVNIDGTSIDAAPTVGKTIADQLVERHRTWKSYQESLPPGGADGVNYSDGFFIDPGDPADILTVLPQESQSLIKLYAAKHNPFVYFRSVQQGGLRNVVGFEGPGGLFDDLAAGTVPDFSLIAPNQCNDQHGRGNAGPACDFDPGPLGDGTYNDGSNNYLNPALIYLGDVTLRTIVNAIHNSKVWGQGQNAIVVVWDENDYSAVDNRVLAIVETNHGGRGVHSLRRYTHFSLLKTIQSGLGLSCLNHTCDADVPVMDDLFGH